MRIVVISDIHGNFFALNALYKKLINEVVDKIVFLGDYLTDCPFMNETMKLIYKFKRNFDCVFLKGNREEYLERTNVNIPLKNLNSLNGSIIYTIKNTKKKYLKFFIDLDYSYVLIYNNFKVHFSHATENNSRMLLLPNDNETNIYLDSMNFTYFVCGHSHLKFIYKYKGKTLINPGALGICEHGEFNANYLNIYIDNKISFDFSSVQYDKKKIIKKLSSKKVKLYGKTYTKCIKDSFIYGYNYASDVIREGIKIAREENKQQEEIDFERAYNNVKEKSF